MESGGENLDLKNFLVLERAWKIDSEKRSGPPPPFPLLNKEGLGEVGRTSSVWHTTCTILTV